jgi:type II secretory pathway component PulF
LSAVDVANLDKALLNAEAFAKEVIDMLRSGQESGGAA